MDIVSRLKLFLDSNGIPNSQFADNCGIPRPTLSQLLNGRNKKISDEVIAKIHSTYPELSIMWLLFGEGNMGNIGNIKISEPQNVVSSNTPSLFDPENQENGSSVETNNPDLNFRQEKQKLDNGNEKSRESMKFGINVAENGVEIHEHNEKESATSISIPSDTLKRITNIVVFYNDNSFQSFLPSQF